MKASLSYVPASHAAGEQQAGQDIRPGIALWIGRISYQDMNKAYCRGNHRGISASHRASRCSLALRAVEGSKFRKQEIDGPTLIA